MSSGRLHVFASLPDGTASSHSRLDGESLTVLAEAPLRSVTGCVEDGPADGLLVCGARAGDDAPAAVRIAADGRVELSMALPNGQPVAAWPRLVASMGKAYAIWAAGSLLQATVWLAEVTPGGLSEPLRAGTGLGTMAFHVAAAPSGIDVLGYGDALDFLRWPKLSQRTLETANDAAATLLNGAVVWPRSSHAFDVSDVAADQRHTLVLPSPPEGGSAQARHLQLAAGSGTSAVLYWETHLPDDFRLRQDDDTSRVVHGYSVRAWLAPFDPVGWRVGASSEVPASTAPPVVIWVGHRLALVRAVSGTVEVALGEQV